MVVVWVNALKRVDRPATLNMLEFASYSVISPAATCAPRIAALLLLIMYSWIIMAASMKTMAIIN